jgi:hypothetical protein
MGAVEVSLDCSGLVTVAVLRHRDGHVEHLRFDGAAELPSGVYRGDDGEFLTGRAALDASIGDPARYVALPMNLLAADAAPGDAARSAAMVAALLGRVREQATRAAGMPVVRGVVVVPPKWGPVRRTLLREAAHRAGLTDIEIVDAATTLARRHAGLAKPGEEHILVLRLAGDEADATILTPGDEGFETLASIHDADIAASDGSALTEHAAALVTKALDAAELTSSTIITTTVLLAPAGRIAAVAAGLRQLGITAKTYTAADADTALGALAAVNGQQTLTTSRPLRQARHAVAAAIPLPGAVALLWLLLHTAILPLSQLAEQISPIPADHALTLWPAWSMPAVLVYIGAIAIVLRSADQRWRRASGDTEAERRTILARGLRVTAAAAVGAGVLVAMLGVTTYPTMPVGQLLLWSAGPAVILAGIAVVLASLIRDGHTSALRWQIWLRMPNLTVALATIGLMLIHVDLYARQNWPTVLANLSIGRNPTGLDRLGAIAVALAILPLLLRRTQQQVLVSPLVIAVIVLTHSYTTSGFVIGALLLAIGLWWITRIRPAAAYSDPHHPASTLAADLEPATPATV